MGHNATVVVMTDALEAIKDDPLFGKKLADAISKSGAYNTYVDVSAGNHVNAATVVEVHHADMKRIIVVGHNWGEVVRDSTVKTSEWGRLDSIKPNKK